MAREDRWSWKLADRTKTEAYSFYTEDGHAMQPHEGESVYHFVCRVLGPERKVLAVRAHSYWYNPEAKWPDDQPVYFDPQNPNWVRRDEYEALVEGHDCSKYITPGTVGCIHCLGSEEWKNLNWPKAQQAAVVGG